jgi:hypothetical protein
VTPLVTHSAEGSRDLEGDGPSPLLEEIPDGQEAAGTSSALVPPLDCRRLGSIRSRPQRCGRRLGSLHLSPARVVDAWSHCPTATATNSVGVSSPPSTSTTAPAGAEDRYLSDLQPTGHKGCGRPGAGDVTIAGTLYPRSVTIVAQKCTGGGTSYVEYTVPEGCQTFSAELGLPDTSAEEDLALIETTTDAGQRQTIKAHRNTGKPVTFPLAGAFHVRLTMQNLASAGFRDVTAAFGDVKFACTG